MITIVCGEDNISSRNCFLNEIKKYKNSGYDVKNIYPKEILNILTGISIQTLFGQNIVYTVENLNKLINKKNLKIVSVLKKISKDKGVHLVDWEDEVQKRGLKFADGAKVIEFKPSRNIFKLLDQCYPSNLKEFLTTYNQIINKTNEYFVLIMLIRHIKKLLLYKINQKPQNVAYWQEKKLIFQSKFWLKDKLVSFNQNFD